VTFEEIIRRAYSAKHDASCDVVGNLEEVAQCVESLATLLAEREKECPSREMIADARDDWKAIAEKERKDGDARDILVAERDCWRERAEKAEKMLAATPGVDMAQRTLVKPAGSWNTDHDGVCRLRGTRFLGAVWRIPIWKDGVIVHADFEHTTRTATIHGTKFQWFDIEPMNAAASHSERDELRERAEKAEGQLECAYSNESHASARADRAEAALNLATTERNAWRRRAQKLESDLQDLQHSGVIS
jgi:hypothetical protein